MKYDDSIPEQHPADFSAPAYVPLDTTHLRPSNRWSRKGKRVIVRDKEFPSVCAAANVIGVSTKTLRAMEQRGQVTIVN